MSLIRTPPGRPRDPQVEAAIEHAVLTLVASLGFDAGRSVTEAGPMDEQFLVRAVDAMILPALLPALLTAGGAHRRLGTPS